MDQPPPTSPPGWNGWLLRPRDQRTVVLVVALGWLATGLGWWWQGGFVGKLVDIDRAGPLDYRFAVDVNRADWPELAQLPEIGETLARAIVASREREGPFCRADDLLRVRGIGRRTLERMRPYLARLPDDPPMP